MWLTHDCHHSDSRGTSNRLRDQLGQDVFLVVLGHGGDDGCERWLAGEEMLSRHISSKCVEVDVFLLLGTVESLLVLVDESFGNVGACSHLSFIFWW